MLYVSDVPGVDVDETRPGEGTLMVNPLFRKATAYYLLRPFFRPKKGASEVDRHTFLSADNWELESEATSVLQGAVPSNCQELNEVLHPHLELGKTMVHVPRIRPGDYVVWHCDSVYSRIPFPAGQGALTYASNSCCR